MKSLNKTIKIVGFSVPSEYSDKVEKIARQERRTKAAVFQAMVDLYEQTMKERELFERKLGRSIKEALIEKKQGAPDPKEWMKEWKELASYGRRQAEALGITEEDVSTMAHEGRSRRK